jgi:hypothetical protein
MSLPSPLLMTWMAENILGLFLAVGWIFLFPKSSSKNISRDAPIGLAAAIIIGVAMIEFSVLRSGDVRRSVDSILENLIAAATMTIIGPTYVAIIGTVAAKYFRRQLPIRTVFCGIVVAATALLLSGGWYATHRLGN